MKIIVRNNDAMKAYKILMKKLKKDGFSDELRKKQHFISKGDKKRIRLKKAIVEHKKDQEKKKEILIKEEKRMIIDAKRRTKEARKNRNNRTIKNQK